MWTCDLLHGVVLVALDGELHDPSEVVIALVDAHIGDVEGARHDGLRRCDEVRLDGIDALDLLVAVLEEGIPGVEFLRVATDHVFGENLVVLLEVFYA